MSIDECRIKEFFLFMVSDFSITRTLPLAKKKANLIKEKKFKNIEHRTSNIEHRIMYSVHVKTTERSDSTIRQSTFDIRHFMKFHKSGGRWPKNGQSD